MTQLDAEAIATVFAAVPEATDADYAVLSVALGGGAYLAVSRKGAPSLLLPVSCVDSESLRLTNGLALRGVPELEFARGAKRERVPAAVIECRDRPLLKTFSAMVAAMTTRLEIAAKPLTWATVVAVFGEWERLLGRHRLLADEAEVGLWAELWCLRSSSRPRQLLDGWRGPDRDHVDFLLGGLGVEVKAGRVAGVHFISQAQVDAPLSATPVVLMSLHVMPDPIRGLTLTSLVKDVARRVDDLAAFEEKLASVGYSRDDEEAYVRPLALLGPPAFYDIDMIPRVRTADAGVSQLRYRVELPTDRALQGKRLDDALNLLGLDITTYDYPCA